MKITVEPSTGGAKRSEVTFAFESSEPVEMLTAAAAYFKSQGTF